MTSKQCNIVIISIIYMFIYVPVFESQQQLKIIHKWAEVISYHKFRMANKYCCIVIFYIYTMGLKHEVRLKKLLNFIGYFLTGIFVFLALWGTFYHANSTVCREVSRNGRKAVWPLIIVMFNMLACIVLIYFVFEDEKLYLW